MRPFLIAYNLYLNSDDVAIANKIARTVRFTSGGLRFVQAMGFLVEGQAQVSMNLTNFEKTPIHLVQELVKREAARYGLTVTKAELIGMIPQKALLESARWYLQIDEFEADQVLENRLSAAQATALSETTPTRFLDATASKTPTPGGGSVAALAGALTAALAQMVAGLTVGRKKYAAVADDARSIRDEAETLRHALTAAIAEDAAAFDAVMAAWRNKELSGAAKEAAVEAATIGAAEVPLRVARLTVAAAHLARRIGEIGNSNAVTDAAAAGLMARAAVQAAALNVKINVVDLQDKARAQTWLDELAQLEKTASTLASELVTIAAQRGGF